MEMGFIQQCLPIPEMAMSATECLNLNVTVPESTAQDPSAKLPVFVFLHGGGFSIGSGSWPQYDQARLIRRSERQGNPVIGVAIK